MTKLMELDKLQIIWGVLQGMSVGAIIYLAIKLV